MPASMVTQLVTAETKPMILLNDLHNSSIIRSALGSMKQRPCILIMQKHLDSDHIRTGTYFIHAFSIAIQIQ